MNVGELKAVIGDLPDDTPVRVLYDSGYGSGDLDYAEVGTRLWEGDAIGWVETRHLVVGTY